MPITLCHYIPFKEKLKCPKHNINYIAGGKIKNLWKFMKYKLPDTIITYTDYQPRPKNTLGIYRQHTFKCEQVTAGQTLFWSYYIVHNPNACKYRGNKKYFSTAIKTYLKNYNIILCYIGIPLRNY